MGPCGAGHGPHPNPQIDRRGTFSPVHIPTRLHTRVEIVTPSLIMRRLSYKILKSSEVELQVLSTQSLI